MFPEVIRFVLPMLMEPEESVREPFVAVIVPALTVGAAILVEANVTVPLESEIVAGVSDIEPRVTGFAKLTEEAEVEIVDPLTESPPRPPAAV
jgi:hypothetical protein